MSRNNAVDLIGGEKHNFMKNCTNNCENRLELMYKTLKSLITKPLLKYIVILAMEIK